MSMFIRAQMGSIAVLKRHVMKPVNVVNKNKYVCRIWTDSAEREDGDTLFCLKQREEYQVEFFFNKRLRACQSS